MTVACQHRYRRNREPCPHATGADSELCPWHNPRVDKSAPYVSESLRALAPADGELDLEECHLIGLDAARFDFGGALLRGADLRDADLRGADLREADLRGAQLRRAHLHGARLTGADLSGADLTDTQLSAADLQGCQLADTLIEGTIFNGADLREADVTGAAIESFYWNRLTRFSGIRGLEPKRDGDDGTQRFIAPFALGDRDISASRRSTLAATGADPELERTRFFKTSRAERLVPPPEPAAASRPRPATSGEPGTARVVDEDLARRVQVYRRANRQLLVVVVLAVVIAVSAVGLGLSGQLSPAPAEGTGPVGPSVAEDPDQRRPFPSGSPATDPGDAGEGLGSERPGDDNLAFYRDRIAALVEELDTAQRQVNDLRTRQRGQAERAAELEERIAVLQRDNADLRARRDDWDDLYREHRQLEATHRELLAESSRLERTARILSDGLGELQAENQRLSGLVSEERLDRITLARQSERIEALEGELVDTRGELERVRAAKASLELDLEEAEQAMTALARRIEGTALEHLLGSDGGRSQAMAIEPGVPLVLGGDVLLTFTVERASADRIRCLLVIQGPSDEPLPEISVILADQQGHSLAKLAYSFQDTDARPGFARAETMLDLRTFPSSARIVASDQLDGSLVDDR